MLSFLLSFASSARRFQNAEGGGLESQIWGLFPHFPLLGKIYLSVNLPHVATFEVLLDFRTSRYSEGYEFRVRGTPSPFGISIA
ncbi:hypothetical protein CEXT_770631 [Caerostris extrusa]|uniref:Secreted protein n=1 Tax=Caerostris extrusa TaxID=172846 RepID=A0AAV4TS58_CAEEX|nr:hypothetical protein CEXT_770631 [Caerostris extrusa]